MSLGITTWIFPMGHLFQLSGFQRAAPALPFIPEISRFEMILA